MLVPPDHMRTYVSHVVWESVVGSVPVSLL